MTTDPRTPVVVGVGQVTNRPSSGDGAQLTERPEPTELMVRAVEAAVEDAGGATPGGASPAGRALLARTQSLRVISPVSWPYLNPGLPVADSLALDPAEIMVTTVGGDNPMRLLSASALAIGRGELDVVVMVGADCVHTQTAAHRHPERPLLQWTLQPSDTRPPVQFGSDRRATTETEEELGLDLPISVYPLFENAVRAEAERGLDQHRVRIGDLWSGFSEVASSNPYAWFTEPRSTDEVITVSGENRMIAYPYTKLLTADMQVDQGAALIICSAEAADAAGISRDRWVFPWAGSDADDHWFLSHRSDFRSSPAIRLAGASCLALAGRSIEQVAHLDLYSCFPSAVQIARKELGIPEDDPSRSLTVTGGMTFAGGPGNNYVTHAVAAMATVLRSDPGSVGLVSGVGWYLTRHSIGVFGTGPAPARSTGGPGLPEGTVVEQAGGFAWADPQIGVGMLPQRSTDADAQGAVTVETYSVTYGRDGAPERGMAACRTPEGRRAWATVTDPDLLVRLVTTEGCGLPGTLGPDGRLDLV